MKAVGKEIRRFWRIALGLAAVIGVPFVVLDVLALGWSREAYAWLLVGLLLVVIVIMRRDERRREARTAGRISAEQHQQRQAPTQRVVDRLSRWQDDVRRVAFERSHDQARERHETRRKTLDGLQREYLLSHDGLPPAVVAGNEPPPRDWMKRRIKEMGRERLFPEYFRDEPASHQTSD